MDSCTALLEQLCIALLKSMGITFIKDILDTFSPLHSKAFGRTLKAVVYGARQLENGSQLQLFSKLCDMLDRTPSPEFFIALSDMIKDISNPHQHPPSQPSISQILSSM